MKKNIFFAIVIILIVAAILAVGVNLGIKMNESFIEKKEENGLQVSVISISQTDSFYNIQVEYPQFKEVDAAFNKEISDLILGEIDSFKKEAKDNWNARNATLATGETPATNPPSPFDFIASWTPTQINKEYVSFSVNIYYFVGGAHGVTEVNAFNYDVIKKADITINDFLGNSQQALQKLSQIAAQQVTSQIQSNGVQIDDFLTQMIQQGTQPTADNYRNFNFNYDSLIIYFQQYQVAPGYLGPLTVILYKNILEENSIKSDYLD
jgi:hypothetical protein